MGKANQLGTGKDWLKKGRNLSVTIAALVFLFVILASISSAVTQKDVDDLVGRLVNVRDQSLSDAISNAKSKERLNQIGASSAFLEAVKTRPELRDLLNKRVAEDLPEKEADVTKGLPRGELIGVSGAIILLLVAVLFAFRKGWFRKIVSKNTESRLITLIKELIKIKEKVKSDSKQIQTRLAAEQTTFDECRTLVAQITEHVKETIGEEKDLATEIERSQKINEKLGLLRDHNEAEESIAAELAQKTLNEAVTKIESIRIEQKEVFAAMNNVQNIHKAFEKADEGLQMLQNVDLAEQGVLDRLQQHFRETIADFEALEEACKGIRMALDNEIDELLRLERGEANYQAILLDIRRLRDNAIKLNELFAKKIRVFKDLVQKLKELELDVRDLGDKETSKLQEYVDLARSELSKPQPSYERVMYYASIVKKNAKHLGLEELGVEAKKIASDALPRLLQAREQMIRELITKIDVLVKTGEREKIDEAVKLLQRAMVSVEKNTDRKIKAQVQALRIKVLGNLLDHAEKKLENEEIGDVKVMADLVERVSRVEGHELHKDHKKKIDELRQELGKYDATKLKEMFDRIVGNNEYRTTQEIEIAKKTIRMFIRAGKDAAEKKANRAYVKQKLGEETQGQHLAAEVIGNLLERTTTLEPPLENLAAKIKAGEVLNDAARKALDDLIVEWDKDVAKVERVNMLKHAKDWNDERVGLRELWTSLPAEESVA